MTAEVLRWDCSMPDMLVSKTPKYDLWRKRGSIRVVNWQQESKGHMSCELQYWSGYDGMRRTVPTSASLG